MTPPRFITTRRRLAAELADRPFTHAAGYGAALLAMIWLCRVAMIVVAVRDRFLRALTPAHALWVGPAIATDLVVAAGFALLLGAIFRATPPRLGKLAHTLGYALLLFACLVCIASVPLYAAMQTTLQLTQLLLAGGLQDLLESALDVVPLPAFLFGLAALLLLCFRVPQLAHACAALGGRLRATRVRVASAAAALALLASAAWLAPEGGAASLERDPVHDFTASVVRYLSRKQTDASRSDMTSAPHFDRSLIRGEPRVEPLETLLHTSALPLSRANVVLIVLESAASRHIGLWQGPRETAPRLIEIARHGLAFDDYYAVAPVSMKSLFSLNCSSYPHPHPQAETYTNPSLDCRSISEILKDQGYRTALLHGGRFSYTRKDEFFKHRRYDVLRDAETLHARGRYPRAPWGADDRAVIDDALAWLAKDTGKTPYFLQLIFLAPHHPYSLRGQPEPFGRKTDLERYRNATLFIDSQVGRLWDFVRARGELDATLFVIVGDHGEAFGEHPGNYTHGTFLYEESVRTPLLLANPRLFSGKRTARVGNHVDIVPTVLDLLGLPREPRHQGVSLLRGYQPHVIYFYGDWHRHFLGLRDGDYKFIYDLDREKTELYDLGADPGERVNLTAHNATTIRAYKDRVLAWERFYRELIPNYDRYVNAKDACPGRSVCYLDELKPVLQHGTLRKNQSAGGQPLQLGGRQWKRGLGVAPLSILRYNLRGQQFRRLTGGAGHHAQGRHANLSLQVSAEIYLDDELLWSSGKMSADAKPKHFDLDVQGGTVLELIGYDVDGEDWRDYLDWVDVRLSR